MSEATSNLSEMAKTFKTEALEVIKLTGRLAIQELLELLDQLRHPFLSRTELLLRREEPPLTPDQKKMAIAAARHTTFSDVEPESHDL